MSESFLTKLKDIEALKQEYGRDGIRLLFLFVTLKTQVRDSLRRKRPYVEVSERTLNAICMQEALAIVRTHRS